MRKRIALVLTVVAIIMTYGSIVYAGSVGGYNVTYTCSVTQSTGSALTIAASSVVTVGVSGTYSYVNYNTLKTGTKTTENTGTAYVSVSFTAPSNCKTVKLASKHTATYGNETWTATDSEVY